MSEENDRVESPTGQLQYLETAASRRRPNGTLHGLMAAAALGHPVSRVWKGYWQR